MNIQLEKAQVIEANLLVDLQVKAFSPLLAKYQDYYTNPANETVERTIERIERENGVFYKILYKDEVIGGICVYWIEEDEYWISPMFLAPEYQGFGFGQQAIKLVEKLHPHAISWNLATLNEEERNCYLYEKMGYKQTGEKHKISEKATLAYYKK